MAEQGRATLRAFAFNYARTAAGAGEAASRADLISSGFALAITPALLLGPGQWRHGRRRRRRHRGRRHRGKQERRRHWRSRRSGRGNRHGGPDRRSRRAVVAILAPVGNTDRIGARHLADEGNGGNAARFDVVADALGNLLHRLIRESGEREEARQETAGLVPGLDCTADSPMNAQPPAVTRTAVTPTADRKARLPRRIALPVDCHGTLLGCSAVTATSPTV